jgi:hypothetical protein
MDNTSYKQVRRTYQNGFSFNFPLALSGFNDFKTKEYSNFYLTNNTRADTFLKFNTNTLKSEKLLTYLQSGSVYLSRSTPIANANTYSITFDDELSERTYFDLDFYQNNLCTISFIESGKTYLLSEDSGDLLFKWDVLLPDEEDEQNPQFFKYIYNDKKELFLIKALSSNKLVKKEGDGLVLIELNDENKNTILTSNFKVARPKEYKLEVSPNTSFVTYQNASNIIDSSKSEFDLSNNFLIHSPYSSEYKDIIVLKNQLTVSDVFTNGQNLLSSGYDIAVDDFRNYTNITNTIDSENSSELSLNYVFYNKPYLIRRGITEFQAPSSMYPFSNLNINDTRFVDCGSYGYDTPQYADKIYQIDTNNYSEDGKVYLCTWLSGVGETKTWVDRYFYPDLISKKNALSEKGVFDITYDQAIENLITTNATLSSNVSKYVIFDKRSDLSFQPNRKYEYHRFNNNELFDIITATNTVDCGGANQIPLNYQNLINDAGKITLSFYFNGSDPEWTIQSLRNNIDAGVKITKTADDITFELKLFNNSNNQTLIFDATTLYKKYKDNFVCFSYDALTGKGFFFLNNAKVLDISTEIAQFSNKSIIYGKFYYNDQDLLEPNGITTDIIIADQKIDENLAFIIPFIQNRQAVDDIVITLPCGMRNSLDDIKHIQTICNGNSNKSNYINVSIDNLGISNSDTLEYLKNVMLDKIQQNIPATSIINNIKFTNYI